MADENEITPQSNYVTIYSDSSCEWNPRFDLSVTHCHVDVTWFPFDEQTCDLIFESWMYVDSVLILETDDIFLENTVRPEGWYIIGM